MSNQTETEWCRAEGPIEGDDCLYEAGHNERGIPHSGHFVEWDLTAGGES